MLSPVSNSLSFLELMKNEIEQVLAKNIDHKCFGPNLSLLNAKVSKNDNKKTGKCYKNFHQYILYLIMSQQPDNFGE